MSVKLIAENILDSGDFLSATEQEGERWAQPTPTSTNQGSMRPVISGTPVDFSYNGFATSNGAAGGTTIICSNLAAYGDDFFIGATIYMASGTCLGESRTVSDFAQATGTLTVSSAFSAQIDATDAFTLSIPFATRDFRLELNGSGDPGTAYFRWSHDGGTTLLGRDDTDQANWVGEVTLTDTGGTNLGPHASARRCALVQADDGYCVVLLQAASDSYCKAYRSQNPVVGGNAWSTGVNVVYNQIPQCVIKLSSGSLLALLQSGNYVYFYGSDDHGVTWHFVGGGMNPGSGRSSLVELKNGSLLCAATDTTNTRIVGYLSNDGGATWGSAFVIASASNTQKDPSLIIAENGDIICAYATDEDTLNQYEVKCVISSNNAATWGSPIEIMAYDTLDWRDPVLMIDVQDYIVCAAWRSTAILDISFKVSGTSGTTWGTLRTLDPAGGGNCQYPYLAQIDGHRCVCVWWDGTNSVVKMTSRGMWESGSYCFYCARDAQPQTLVCGASVIWHGGSGISGDDWSFTPEYDYAMANIIEDSPSKPWRTKQDNLACAIVIDMGSLGRMMSTGVAFFGCNVRTLSFQMNDTNSWGGPTVDESVSFDITTGGVVDTASDANEIRDDDLLANYKKHELSGLYLRMTSGPISGVTYKILDNSATHILVDGDCSDAAVGNTFCIFGPSVAKTFTGSIKRFVRIYIANQLTAENYYQIGFMIAGEAITLTDAFANEYRRDHEYGIQLMDTAAGGTIPIKDFGRKRRFSVSYAASNSGRKEVLALIDYLDGKNIAMVLDSTNMKECYLVKLRGAVTQVHQFGEYFSLEAEFEEVL